MGATEVKILVESGVKTYKRNCLWCEKKLETNDISCWSHNACRQVSRSRVLLPDELSTCRGRRKGVVKYD